MPGAVLLFSPGAQQIDELNESSGTLARRLIRGATLDHLIEELTAMGVAHDYSRDWAIAFLQQLANAGVLTAETIEDAAPEQWRQNISVVGVAIALVFDSQDLLTLVGAAFDHLQTEVADVECTFFVSQADDFIFIARDSRPAAVVDRARAAVFLKAAILDELLHSAEQLCALHAACLGSSRGSVLLLGAPGAGKTTMCLALLRLGFTYHSDDITLVRNGQQVHGVALAPSVKEGTWELMRAAYPQSAELPVHMRPDGQTVRFLPTNGAVTDATAPVTMIVRLRRVPGETARLVPISAAEAVADLLRDARSPSGHCSPEIFQAIAGLARGAQCLELSYSEASEGALALRDHSDE